MRKNRRPLAFVALITFSVLAGLSSPLARGAEFIELRGGLPATIQKLQSGQKVTVAYFGGSITAGAGASKPEFCYRSLFTRYLKEHFPKADIHEINAAIGGTGSWLGAFRLKNDALSKEPDLVIVEFAVNDGGSPEQQVLASMEGVVRQIRAARPRPEILFVYTMVKAHLDQYKAGELPNTVAWDEKLAEHYNIPSVNMAQFAAGKIIETRMNFDDFARDGVHPTDKGYQLYLAALKAFVEKAEAQPAGPPAGVEVTPLSKEPMENASLVPWSKARADENWKPDQKSPAGFFPSVIASDVPGATLTLRFKGSRIGFFDAIGPDSGDMEFSMDKGPWQPKADFDKYCVKYYRAHDRVLVEGLDARKEHELRLRVAEKQPPDSKGRFVRIGYFLVDGEVE